MTADFLNVEHWPASIRFTKQILPFLCHTNVACDFLYAILRYESSL